MGNKKRILGVSAVVLGAGYLVGLLTAPRSGLRTRKRIKKTADNSVADIERQLKSLYKQSQEQIDKFNKQNPQLSTKLKQTKDTAIASQNKIKDLLSAIHGNDSVDEDLSSAINDAKQALKHLGKYITKT